MKHLSSINVKNKRHRYSLALELVNANILSSIFPGDDPNSLLSEAQNRVGNENIRTMIRSEMFFAITVI